MKFARKSLFPFLLMAALLASCAGQATDAPTPDINASLTAGIGTLMAGFFETQTAAAPPATETPSITPLPPPTSDSPIVLLPTVGSIASPTTAYIYLSPTPTGTFRTATPNPASLAYGCNNLAFLQDVTIPAGTVMKPGQTFTKEWKVLNNGTCAWDWSYRVVFISGNSMGGSFAHPNQDIAAGNSTKLRVPLEAPNKEGTYIGYWQLSDAEGHTFGALLAVSIVVTAPTKTPGPTKTSTSTSVPTNTNVPTNTDIPTSTDIPTETPTPTP